MTHDGKVTNIDSFVTTNSEDALVSLLSRCLEQVAVIAVRFTNPTYGQITTKLQLIVIMTPSVCFHPFYVQTLKLSSAWFLLHKVQDITYH